ncbi:MAG: hypothetical protein R3C45_08140 [Phycisphaerales bacterium]
MRTAIIHILLLLAFSVSLNGCAFLAGAAAGGATGYVAGHHAGENEAEEEIHEHEQGHGDQVSDSD